ncbi:MAG: hypothetical protein ABI051_07565 [Vicinamibacterales bacterium]
MSKKWYSYFVVSDEHARAGEGGSTSPSSVSPSTPGAQRVVDVAADPATEPVITGPVTRSTDLDLVYASAQITAPPHGYTVLKVAEMLQSEHIKALPVDVKRKSIMVALDAAGVKVTDIVEDAVRRDRALDTYERVLQRHVDDQRAQIEVENKRIEEDIERRVTELRARIDANNQKLTTETGELVAWRTRKHQEEMTIADAVGYFVSENPITTPARTAADSVKGDADVR